MSMLVAIILMLSAGADGSSHDSAMRFCRQGDARYALAGARGFTLSFVKVPARAGLVNDLVIRIHLPRGNTNSWYYFDEGSRPGTSLISTVMSDPAKWTPDPDGGERPFGTATFVGMYKDGRIAQSSPTSSSRAVDYVVIPELAAALKKAAVPNFRNGAFTLVGCESK